MTTLTNDPTSESCPQHAQNEGTPCILCIDDDPNIHTNVEMRMQAYDVRVEHAYFGMQGIVEAIDCRPDLIITDIAMPNGDGSYVVKMIRQNAETSNVPVIVLTGMCDPALKSRVLKDGANEFLRKPLRFSQLHDHISRFIELKKRS